MTYTELVKKIREHNEGLSVRQFGDKDALTCVVVFKESNWPDKNYSLESRSYCFRSDNKRFLPHMLGNSIFAGSLDGSDENVRLDYYLGEWEIDYCYIK